MSILSILMERDGMTEEEAEEAIQECREDFNQRIINGEMPYNILEEYFGLEPDYIHELFE